MQFIANHPIDPSIFGEGLIDSLKVCPLTPPSELENPEESKIKQRLDRLFDFFAGLSNTFYKPGLKNLVDKYKADGILSIKEIKILDLSHCKLTEIPEDVCLLNSLETLNLINNELNTLPQALSKLSDHLRRVELEKNHFEKVPVVIEEIARERIKNKKYFELFLRENPMPTVPKELKSVVRSLPNCYSYFS